MWHNETMEYYRRINQKFDRDILHGQQGIYNPGLIFGSFRNVYLAGIKEGEKIRRLQVKTKK